jgi:hypothetical protein
VTVGRGCPVDLESDPLDIGCQAGQVEAVEAGGDTSAEMDGCCTNASTRTFVSGKTDSKCG